MRLRDEIAGLDEIGAAVALIRWSTGVEPLTPCVDAPPGRPPMLLGPFVETLPDSLQWSLVRSDFVVEGRPEIPGRRFPVLAHEDGSLWGERVGRPTRVARSAGALLLDGVLGWIRLHVPAALELELDDDAALSEVVGRFEPLVLAGSEDASPAPTWLVGDDVVCFVLRGPFCPNPSVTILGPSRQAVEGEGGTGGEVGTWVSVERAMEPATDRWSEPHRRSPGAGRLEVTRLDEVIGLDEVLGGDDGVRALERFLDVWYGIELPEAVAADRRPAALARLARVPSVDEIFGDSELLVHEPAPPSVAVELRRHHPEVQVAWAACQLSVIVGFVPNGTDDPSVVIAREGPPEPDAESGAAVDVPLSRVLLRVLIDQAMFASPVCVSTSSVDASEAERILAPLRVAMPRVDRWSPVLTDGRILVIVDGREVAGIRPPPSIRVAAQHREDVVVSPIGQLARLDWQYEDESRAQQVPIPAWVETARALRSSIGPISPFA